MRVYGPGYNAGYCSDCAEHPTPQTGFYRNGELVEMAPAAKRESVRQQNGGSHLSGKDLRSASEGELRWFFNEAAGELGLRAISVANDLVAPAAERIRLDDGVWRIKPSRTIVVRGMSAGQLAAAHKCRRVVGRLARLGQRDGRILQRRYERDHYYGDLDTIFGEWSGLVDYLRPDVSEVCKPREGKKPNDARIVGYVREAQDVFSLSLRRYMRVAQTVAEMNGAHL
jgi:hypothetical protein